MNNNLLYHTRKGANFIRSSVDVVYLTWQHDPTTTMTIQWHTRLRSEPEPSDVLYREEGTSDWVITSGTSNAYPESTENRRVHFCEITGLNPGTVYEFKFASDVQEFIRKFETMPAELTSSIKIAVASDCHGIERNPTDIDYFWFEDLTKNMGGHLYDADILLGVGDYTYDEGLIDEENTQAWVNLLKLWEKYLIKSNGCMIPMLLAIGNHDVFDLGGNQAERKLEDIENFMRLFAFPTKEEAPIQKPCLGNMKFGSYLQILLLDTGTLQYGINDIEQLDFLDAALEGDKATHIIPAYHRPMYGARGGSFGFNNTISTMFANRFDDAGVRLVVEGHNHVCSWTREILGGQVVESGGRRHLGDGTWARNRAVGPAGATEQEIEDHIASSAVIEQAYGWDYKPDNAKMFWGIEIYPDKFNVKAINYLSEVFYEKETML